MNENLFSFKVTKCGNDTSKHCRLFNNSTKKQGNNKSKHVTEITVLGLFLIGIAVALTNDIDLPIEPENKITEVTQEQDPSIEPTG